MSDYDIEKLDSLNINWACTLPYWDPETFAYILIGKQPPLPNEPNSYRFFYNDDAGAEEYQATSVLTTLELICAAIDDEKLATLPKEETGNDLCLGKVAAIRWALQSGLSVDSGIKGQLGLDAIDESPQETAESKKAPINTGHHRHTKMLARREALEPVVTQIIEEHWDEVRGKFPTPRAAYVHDFLISNEDYHPDGLDTPVRRRSVRDHISEIMSGLDLESLRPDE